MRSIFFLTLMTLLAACDRFRQSDEQSQENQGTTPAKITTLSRAPIVPDNIKTELRRKLGRDYEAAFSGYHGDDSIGITRSNHLVDTFTIDHSKSGFIRVYNGGAIKIDESGSTSFFRPSKHFINYLRELDARDNVIHLHFNDNFAENANRFRNFYLTLTPQMRSNVRGFIDTPDVQTRGRSSNYSGVIIAWICSALLYHEAAHLLTHQHIINLNFLPNQWMRLFNTARRDFPEGVHSAGFVTQYAQTNYEEDICELVQSINDEPSFVRQYANTPEKIRLLNQGGYLRNDQYRYLTYETDEIPEHHNNFCDIPPPPRYIIDDTIFVE